MANAQFTIPDYAVFVLMLVVSVAIGVHSALRGGGSSSTQQYLLGGRRMSPIPVAISLLGGIISAISILGRVAGHVTGVGPRLQKKKKKKVKNS